LTHPRAKLTVQGRRLLVQRVLEQGWSPAEAARARGCRWRPATSGWVGIGPRAWPGWPTAPVGPIAARSGCRQSGNRQSWPGACAIGWAAPDRLGAGEARSTVWAVLARHQLPRLAELDRPSGQVVGYQRQRPGELVHVDSKAQGRIPEVAATGCWDGPREVAVGE
jgi:hypothetical protein